MPNWVCNKVRLETEDKELLDKIFNEIKGGCEEYGEFDFNTVVPMPDKVYKEDLTTEARKKFPGELNWYEWSIKNWGTKWNACDCIPKPKGANEIEFNTAWSAPHPVIKALSEKYPSVKVIHKWADEDLGNNCGIAIYKGGKELYFDDKEGLFFACDVWDYDYEELINENYNEEEE